MKTKTESYKKVVRNHEMLEVKHGLADSINDLANMLQNNSNFLIAEGKYTELYKLDKLTKELIIATNKVEYIIKQLSK